MVLLHNRNIRILLRIDNSVMRNPSFLRPRKIPSHLLQGSDPKSLPAIRQNLESHHSPRPIAKMKKGIPKQRIRNASSTVK
jgi:hypothetical protein